MILTFIFVFGRDRNNSMLNVFIFIDFRFIEGLIEIWRVVIFVSNSDTNIFGDYNCSKGRRRKFDAIRGQKVRIG